MAGVCAAIAGGRLGARVLLVEAMGNLGGMATSGLVTAFDGMGDVERMLVGADCLLSGTDTEHIMPPTLCGIYSRGERSWEARKYKDQAVEDNFFGEENDNVNKYSHLIPSYSGDGTFSLHAGHVFDTDATKIASLTHAMVKGRKLSALYEAFFRKYVPGCESVTLAATATLLGVRESRWIVGEYQLTFDDFIKRRKFPDQIAVFNKETDIHIYYPTAEEQRRKEATDKQMPGKGECYGIPYGLPVPKGWKNLWTAGRCVSVDNMVHGSTRCMPSSAMMGQAAGTAAVQSVSTGQTADHLNSAELVKTLRQNQAYLPQTKLTAEMTRS
jgi:hypothetical protein